MTENEALNELRLQSQVLERRILCNKEIEEFVSSVILEHRKNAVDIAIQALEEIQAYRAIGTVERLLQLQHDYWYLNEMCKEYSAIGTVEEFKALKEKNEPKKLNNSLEEDEKIGGYCPNCNGTVLIKKTFLRKSKGKCCDWCGQKIDWQ